MTEKDFSTIKKCLKAVQKIQYSAKVASFWIHYYQEDNYRKSWFVVTVTAKDGDSPKDFDFYNHKSATEHLMTYKNLCQWVGCTTSS